MRTNFIIKKVKEMRRVKCSGVSRYLLSWTVAGLAGVLMLAAVATSAWAQEGRGVYFQVGRLEAGVGGEQKILEAAPYLRNNRVMVPVRLVAEALGGSVTWSASNRTITVRTSGKTVVLTVGRSAATVNGRRTILDAPVEIHRGRAFVPVRFIAEALGFQVEWDGTQRAVWITSGKRAKIVLAVQPTVAAAEVVEKAKPLQAFLERALRQRGIAAELEVYVPLSQAGVVEALRFGQAQAALMGAWPAFLAVDLGAGDLALAEVREVVIDGEKKEASFYFSYWVVPKESPYRSLQDLRGRRACLPSPTSTSGYIAPVGRLVELGLLERPGGGEADPRRFFGEILFGGGYAQCWEALKRGQVEVTVIAGDVPERLYREVLAGTRILEKQGPVPSHGLVVARSLKEPLRGVLVEAFLELNAPEQRSLMRQFVSGIFVRFERRSANEHFGGLWRYLELTGLKFTERLGR